MTCTRCGSSEVSRSRRNGACDQIQSWFGRYPYRCNGCGKRFRTTGRYQGQGATGAQRSAQKPAGQARQTPPSATGESNRPEMAFRAHPAKPQAKIVVQAETHEQLNHILLALDKAIHSYGNNARAENTRASYASR